MNEDLKEELISIRDTINKINKCYHQPEYLCYDNASGCSECEYSVSIHDERQALAKIVYLIDEGIVGIIDKKDN